MRASFHIAITPEHVGQRVTIRSRIATRPGEPGHTDTVGWLRSWEDGILTVERRNGTLATLEEAALVGARVIGPPPVRARDRNPSGGRKGHQ